MQEQNNRRVPPSHVSHAPSRRCTEGLPRRTAAGAAVTLALALALLGCAGCNKAGTSSDAGAATTAAPGGDNAENATHLSTDADAVTTAPGTPDASPSADGAPVSGVSTSPTASVPEDATPTMTVAPDEPGAPTRPNGSDSSTAPSSAVPDTSSSVEEPTLPPEGIVLPFVPA